MVLVAGVDTHTVHALRAEDGKSVWKYTAGARVNSPPTLHEGLAIFGSADGRVYCLRASDGELVWRFDAAPRRRLVTAFDHLESPWPVPGSVLVHGGKCWFAAGRSSYVDGGMYLFALDPATGKVDRQDTIYSADPKTGKMTPEPDGHAMSGLLSDIPATDGASVFIRQMNVSSSGRVASPGEGRAGRHLYSTSGYLDSSWFNRTFWSVGGVRTSGIMVMGEDVVYGVEIYTGRGANSLFKPGAQGCQLTCYSLTEQAPPRAPKGARRSGRAKPGRKVIWQQRVPIRITAMVRAADKLFVAGSPDVVDPEDPHGAWEGRKGGILAVFDATSGEKLSEVKLDAPPVWDGMAVAAGRLFVSTINGKIVCLSKRNQ